MERASPRRDGRFKRWKSFWAIPRNLARRNGSACVARSTGRTITASSEASGGGSTTRTTAASQSGRRGGRYVVEGLTMRITYDDGARESLVFMSHPRDPNIIWLDGVSYVRGK